MTRPPLASNQLLALVALGLSSYALNETVGTVVLIVAAVIVWAHGMAWTWHATEPFRT